MIGPERGERIRNSPRFEHAIGLIWYGDEVECALPNFLGACFSCPVRIDSKVTCHCE